MVQNIFPNFNYFDITGPRIENNPLFQFVLFITACTVIYGWGYFENSSKRNYVLPLLILFGLSMAGLVIANHLLWLYFFWECTSVFSYLLIGTYYEKKESRESSLQALFITGAGGLSLLLGLLLLGEHSGSYYLSEIQLQHFNLEEPIWSTIVVLLLFGIITKSGLLPFQGWLPNAMVAPAPVSGFLHSATLVKAGVILITFLAPVFQEMPLWENSILLLAGLTAWYGAFMALLQNDLKKALAYTTSATIGLIGFASWTEAGNLVAFSWILAHGLYKSASFYFVGIIEKKYESRNILKLRKLFSIEFFDKIIGFSLFFCCIGIPFTASYYAKKHLVDFYLNLFQQNYYAFVLCTIWQSLMLINYFRILVFPYIGTRERYQAMHESAEGFQEKSVKTISIWMKVIPVVLAISSVLSTFKLSQRVTIHASDVGIWEYFTVAVYGLFTLLFFMFYRYHHFVNALGKKLYTEILWKWCYKNKLRMIEKIAIMQTNIVQNGYLRYYLTMFVVATILLLGGSIYFYSETFIRKPVTEILIYELIIVAMIIIAAFMSTITRSRMASIVSLGAVGMGCSVLYLFYSAPDLAMTQFLTDTLIVVVMALLFYDLPRYSRLSSKTDKIRDGIIACIFGGVISILVLSVTDAQIYTEVMDTMLKKTIPEARGHNVVNVILADFRAIDTLGEISVLTTAAIGMYGLLRIRTKKGGDES